MTRLCGAGRRRYLVGVIVTAEAGVTYHNKKRTAAPFVRSMVVHGTVKKFCNATPPDTITKRAGKCRERPLAHATTKPHANAATGAISGPTDAMPSVAKSEAFSVLFRRPR